MYVGVPKTTPGSEILWEDSWFPFITAQDTKPNQQREKACGVKRPQETKDKLPRSLPVESTQDALNSPAIGCDATSKM